MGAGKSPFVWSCMSVPTITLSSSDTSLLAGCFGARKLAALQGCVTVGSMGMPAWTPGTWDGVGWSWQGEGAAVVTLARAPCLGGHEELWEPRILLPARSLSHADQCNCSSTANFQLYKWQNKYPTILESKKCFQWLLKERVGNTYKYCLKGSVTHKSGTAWKSCVYVASCKKSSRSWNCFKTEKKPKENKNQIHNLSRSNNTPLTSDPKCLTCMCFIWIILSGKSKTRSSLINLRYLNTWAGVGELFKNKENIQLFGHV